MTVGAVLEKSEDELLALRNFGRKSYDELRDKLIEMGFLQEGVEGMGGGTGAADAPARTIVPESGGEDEELGPVAKALLEALKESGREDLIESEDEGEDEEEA
jgi:DNA-directed RNA polymerase subunit alpha